MDIWHWILLFVCCLFTVLLVWLGTGYSEREDCRSKELEKDNTQFYWGCRPKIEFAWRTKDGDLFNQIYVRNPNGTISPVPLVQRLMDTEVDFASDSMNVIRKNCIDRVTYVGSYNHVRENGYFSLKSVDDTYIAFDRSTLLRTKTAQIGEAAQFVLVKDHWPYLEESSGSDLASVLGSGRFFLYIPSLHRYVDERFNATSTEIMDPRNVFTFSRASNLSTNFAKITNELSNEHLDNTEVVLPPNIEPKIILFTSPLRKWHIPEPIVDNLIVCDVKRNIKHKALRNGASVVVDISGCPIDDEIVANVYTMGKASDTFTMVGENNLEIETVKEIKKGTGGLIVIAEALVFDSLVESHDHSKSLPGDHVHNTTTTGDV